MDTSAIADTFDVLVDDALIWVSDNLASLFDGIRTVFEGFYDVVLGLLELAPWFVVAILFGLLAWRRHGPPPGTDRSPLENGLVAFGVPFGAVMGIQQAFAHTGGFARDVFTREAFWWGLASGLTISLPIALWGGALFGRFLKRR